MFSNKFNHESLVFYCLGWQTLTFYVIENPREECDSVARMRP